MWVGQSCYKTNTERCTFVIASNDVDENEFWYNNPRLTGEIEIEARLRPTILYGMPSPPTYHAKVASSRGGRL
jgi:hypothetical protein